MPKIYGESTSRDPWHEVLDSSVSKCASRPGPVPRSVDELDAVAFWNFTELALKVGQCPGIAHPLHIWWLVQSQGGRDSLCECHATRKVDRHVAVGLECGRSPPKFLCDVQQVHLCETIRRVTIRDLQPSSPAIGTQVLATATSFR